VSYPLEPNSAQMSEIGEAALAFVADHIRGLPDAPASDVEGFEALIDRFRAGPPEVGGELAPRLADLDHAVSKSFNTAAPGYLAYIPGGGLYTAAIADFLALGVNRYVGLWAASPLLVQMEDSVVRWLCDLFGFPPESRGFLSSGGSMANFSAVVTARRAMLPEEFLDGVIYVTDQVHASVTKAAALAGFPKRSVQTVGTTPEHRMDVDALRVMVRDDRKDGLKPFMVVASAGTTNTGTVDPIAEIAEIAELENLWLHVDGAYGGAFQMTQRGSERFRGIDKASSVTFDPHKGMFLPYGTGALIVRDGAALRFAHQSQADYLQDLAPDSDLPNYSEYSPELSREFRGLRVWLPLQLHGVAAFREALDEKLDLARHVHESLSEIPGLEIPVEPDLSVVAFRLSSTGANDDELNRRLLDLINASGRVFLSSTVLDGRFTIRAAVLSHRTHLDRIDEAIDIIKSAVTLVAST